MTDYKQRIADALLERKLAGKGAVRHHENEATFIYDGARWDRHRGLSQERRHLCGSHRMPERLIDNGYSSPCSFHSEGVTPQMALKERRKVFSLANPDSSATCDKRIVGFSRINSWAKRIR